MASIVRTLFQTKRRKTESSSSANGSDEPAPPPAPPQSPHLAPMTSSSSTLTLTAQPPHGHRRQHSSPGHLMQFSQQPHSHLQRGNGRAPPRRRNTEAEIDLTERPPKFKHRSPYFQCSGHLENTDIRMIIVEADSRVMYDTATVIPIRYGRHPAARGMSACGEFQYLRKRKDTQKLSNMIFGAVPTAKSSESFRIHVLEDEELILVSKTFAIPKTQKKIVRGAAPATVDHTSSDSDSQSTVKSLDGWRTRTTKSVMSTPEAFSRVRHISITFGEEGGDAESSHFGSSSSTLSLPRAFSPPHRISKARRRQLAVTTSLSETSSIAVPSGLKARSRMSSISSSHHDEDHFSTAPHNMKNIALGIIVPKKHRLFLMQHIPLIESEMARFEARITTAAQHSPTFMHNISKSWEELTEIICQLHNAPRLKHPYWLALNEKCLLDEKTLAVEFCEQLAYLVRRYDRKEAGYFLSNLVTALLMHHMSWVASVASPPLGHADLQKQRATTMFGGWNATEGAPTVGYNALMAQYLEISGACGAMRSAKLCILGEDVEILASVCAVLSFFIRCSAVQHVDSDKMWEVPAEQQFSPFSVAGSPNSTVGSPPTRANGSAPVTTTMAVPVHFDETTSVAMMRRLRNNNQPASSPSSSSPTVAASLEGQSLTDSVTIDRVDFPCCPTISDTEEMWPNSEETSLGRSMFAGPLDQYCPHFVLSGLVKNETNLHDVYSRMFDEVRCTDSPCHRSVVVPSACSSSQSSFFEVTPENVLIVADLEEMRVKVLSSDGADEVTSPSESVVAMLEQFVGIHDAMPATAEFLVGIIEDSLAQIVGKSLTLVELVRADQSRNSSPLQLTPDRVRTIIGCDHSDLRLIVNVAAVYWPPVHQSVLG